MTSENPSPPSEPSETPPHAEAGSPPTLPTGDYSPPIETTPPLDAGAAATETLAENVRRIGRYQVFDEVGHGGMGNVFRGRDPELERELAIKVLRVEHQLRPDLVRRFIEEARVGGGLQHPGVVPVYELGHAAADDAETACPYFTMKLIEGRTLAALLAERRDPGQDLPRFLKVFEQICQTLAYAHARGVVHRDLKPANVMVGAFGEVQVMDWGLAKVLRTSADVAVTPADTGTEPSDQRMTQAGAIVGTPGYMPPEQARGEPIDERGDVFGLGAILCEILTGRPPYAAGSGRMILEQAQRGDLTDAFSRLDGCGADEDLSSLAKECLAPWSADRPRHAGVVTERIAAHLATVQERLRDVELRHAAAQARAEEARAKAAVERRARRLTMTLAAVILLTTLAGGAAAWGFQRERHRLALQEMTRQTEEARKEAVTAQAISSNLEQAGAERDLGRPAAALAATRKAEGLLAGGGEALRPRVKAMLADLEMLAQLEALHLETVEMLPDQSGFDPRPLSPRYRQAFERYGVPVLTLETDAAVEKVRRSAIRLSLVTALDHWAAFAPDVDARRRLLAIAQGADPEPDGVMAALRQAMRDKDSNAFKRTLFTDARVKDLPPLALFVLGSSLLATGNASEAVRLLESARARRPQDFWLNYQLGVALSQLKPPRNAESVRYCTAAIALRPDVPSLWVNLGGSLATQGRLPEAIAAFNQAIDLKPDYALAHYSLGVARMKGNDTARGRKSLEEALRLQPNFAPAHYALGNLLVQQREPAKAEKHLREAIRLKPNYADAHNDLANVLAMVGKRDDAISSYRMALIFAPNDVKIWKNLGESLGRQGRWEEAADSFENALRLDPNNGEVHNDLGFVRLQQRRANEAIAALRKAVALQPNSLKAHANLANALRLGGQRKETIPIYRKVIEMHPSPDTHYNLANVLLESGDLAGAKASCEEALKLKPDYAEARVTLGLVLLSQGQFDEARTNLTEGRDLLARNDPRRAQIQAAIGDCDRLPRLIGKLPAILKGEAKPADNGELIVLASYCMQVQHHYASAARLLADGFAADDKLADDPRRDLRFQAARAAVQAAAGQGEDATALDDKGRLRWRKQALEWLRADLTAWSKSMDRGTAAARAQARAALEAWRIEPLLAAVREPNQQVWLPEDERQAWRKLWAEVADLCKKDGS